MPVSELTLMVIVTASVGLVALALLVAGKIPIPKPLSFVRVFPVLFLLFMLFIVPISLLRLPHSYSSTCRIKVSSLSQPAVSDSQLLRNEMDKILSEPLLRPVMSELSVETLFGAPLRSVRLNENDAYQLLRRVMKVKPVPATAELDLTVLGENGEMPAVFANRIASEYVAQASKQNPEIRTGIVFRAKPAALPAITTLARNMAIGLVLAAFVALLFTGIWAVWNGMMIRIPQSTFDL